MNLSSFPQRAINNGNIKKWRKRHSKGSTTVTHVFEKAENFNLTFQKEYYSLMFEYAQIPGITPRSPPPTQLTGISPRKLRRDRKEEKKYVPFGEINVIHISAREEKRIPSPPYFLPSSFLSYRTGREKDAVGKSVFVSSVPRLF